jgi:membrane protein DedA with SNARE-associated domain
MPSWAQSGIPLVVFLFFVVFFRAQGTYWIARSVPTAISKWGTNSKRFAGLAKWVDGPVPRKGANILEHWGIVAIPLCFLTVGMQTAVLAGSGLVRMNWGKFTAAMIPGCVAWALLYGYGLLAVWTAVVKAAAGSPWAWAALAALVGTVLVLKQRGRIRTAATARVSN